MLVNGFNPRPRTEGDPTLKIEIPRGTVSIHALVRRATLWFILEMNNRNVSIHALVRRATRYICDERGYPKVFQSTPSYGGRRGFPHKNSLWICRFNPRPRTEGDVEWMVMYSGCIVSIHALVRRATCLAVHSDKHCPFQSTPSYGGRQKIRGAHDTRQGFQSTPSYGGRPLFARIIAILPAGFNPRPRTEGDAFL